MLPPIKTPQPTPPAESPSAFDTTHILHALYQAEMGSREGGVPIGAALASISEIIPDFGPEHMQVSANGTVLGVGRNQRVQKGSSIRHGETDCLENIGRLPASAYKGCTMFTTLSPCTMCAGAIILFGIERVVIGENSTFVGGEDILRERGVELVNLDLPECKKLMADFISSKPHIWNEDIGEL